MMHSKRKILLVEDISNAMSILNVPRVLGYQSALNNYSYVKASNTGRKEWSHAIEVYS
jgi:hypothetical protein